MTGEARLCALESAPVVPDELRPDSACCPLLACSEGVLQAERCSLEVALLPNAALSPHSVLAALSRESIVAVAAAGKLEVQAEIHTNTSNSSRSTRNVIRI